MTTTVTGMFPNHRMADLAMTKLTGAGFAANQVQVVDASTPSRHDIIDRKTSDAKRAVVLGLVFGCSSGLVAGVALAGVFGLLQATVTGGLAGAAGGALLGLLVGGTTRSQVMNEIENQVDSGTVLVSVTAQLEQEPMLMELLAQEGGSQLVASAASFTGGVLPVTKP